MGQAGGGQRLCLGTVLRLPLSILKSLTCFHLLPSHSLFQSCRRRRPIRSPSVLSLPLHSISVLPFLWPPRLSVLRLPPFIRCGWWLTGSCWLANGGGYSSIIPPRLPARLATMSQELNICHYYLLVLFDFEAAQWPVSAGFIPPPSVVRFKVDYSNPWAPDSAKSWSFLSFAHSFCPLSPVLFPPPPKWNYIHLLAHSITNVHTLTGFHTSRGSFVAGDAAAETPKRRRMCVFDAEISHPEQPSPSFLLPLDEVWL